MMAIIIGSSLSNPCRFQTLTTATNHTPKVILFRLFGMSIRVAFENPTKVYVTTKPKTLACLKVPYFKKQLQREGVDKKEPAAGYGEQVQVITSRDSG